MDKVEGELGEAQMTWLERRLTNNPEKPALLVGHHYPQKMGTRAIQKGAVSKITGLIDSADLLKLIEGQTTAKAYICGHSRNWRLIKGENHCHQINLPPTAHLFDPSRPAGWVRATLHQKGLKLELRALDSSHPEHGEIHELTWR